MPTQATSGESPTLLQKALFLLALALCLLPFVSPPIALALGLLIALTIGNPFAKQSKKWTKILLQISVVGLGFGNTLQRMAEAGKDGILFTVATIVGTLLLGYLVGRWLKLSRKTAHLISSGTAICGGSAIAAVGPVLNADDKEMSVALGTIFILNSIALFLFPAIGHALSLSQRQFGIWAAIAIHDTSSVVGAAQSYGAEAQAIATVVKLARALWIVPLVFLTSFLFKQKETKVTIPWFILFYLIATVIRTYTPPTFGGFYDTLVTIAKVGLTITLFLIGSGLSRAMLKATGPRPLIHGVILWVVISLVSLWGVISFL